MAIRKNPFYEIYHNNQITILRATGAWELGVSTECMKILNDRVVPFLHRKSALIVDSTNVINISELGFKQSLLFLSEWIDKQLALIIQVDDPDLLMFQPRSLLAKNSISSRIRVLSAASIGDALPLVHKYKYYGMNDGYTNHLIATNTQKYPSDEILDSNSKTQY